MEESVGLLCDIKRVFECSEKDVRMYSPLTLAYIGDGIYDLVIRSVVVERANRPNGELHKRTIGYVKAQTQSKIIQALSDILTEEERDIYKRGRNAKTHMNANFMLS